ncbi:PASTA domain-containing protein [Zeaxanthinibacter enoshimensis]|uniref:PASTA domain-containing protein n=1 Tax=Zeaxanthinibacter enoshimensis TaxID=392009 RepID=A0A4R6TK32_9FLAO|nr:PASTA domain-containing protein [Zeaxanthinibacter enoshimensis]TDQ30782.1 PASTA domain-containing protein [Zeaxanthinibacter enoshimensis]
MKDFIKFLGSRTFLINLGLAAVSVVLLTILAMQWLRSSTNHGEYVEVPDLSRLSVTEMRKKIEEAGLRYEVMDSANFNPDYPRFSIIEQTPKGGNKVKENRKIYVTVNPSGYKKVSVPNIIQVTQRNAESMLRAVGLEVERVTYIDQLGKNMVYYIKHKGKQVKPGDKLPKKSEIELVCGNGTIPGSARVQSDSE